MKYLLMIYSNPANWEHPTYLRVPEFRSLPESERSRLDEQFGALLQEISESGELVTGTPLADPVTCRTVRVREGVPAVTDGPFLESREQLAGYFVVDCDTPQRAIDIASRFPDACFGGVEVRPIMDESGHEM